MATVRSESSVAARKMRMAISERLAARSFLKERGSAAPSAQLSQVNGADMNATMDAASGVMLRDPRLDELMAAHKQFGGTSALQMPSGFLRNATFDGPTRRDRR